MREQPLTGDKYAGPPGKAAGFVRYVTGIIARAPSHMSSARCLTALRCPCHLLENSAKTVEDLPKMVLCVSRAARSGDKR